jgi:hypothetical protein
MKAAGPEAPGKGPEGATLRSVHDQVSRSWPHCPECGMLYKSSPN